MKKILYCAAGLMCLAACESENGVSSISAENPLQQEICIRTAALKTKGFVTGTLFYDTAVAQLHAESPVTTPRTMQLSAYLTPQAGEEGDYFVDYTFSCDEDPDSPTWRHNPAIYWPVGGKLDFLSYSSQTPFDAKDVTWNEKNSASSVVINVLEDRTQDDIMYCSVSGQNSSGGASPVPMEFKHAQAWLEFQIKVAEAGTDGKAMEGKIAIKSIEIENIYCSGELTIENNSGEAIADWSFRHEQSHNVLFDDNYGLYGGPGTGEGYPVTGALKKDISYMDMLIPGQQKKTAFVITYLLAGQPKELKYRYDLTSGTAEWLCGARYIYEITFNINEITAAPTVKAYETGVVSELTPDSLS
ncbi:MAG: fimbrillin family protein [Bacteroidales bacterium]|nr:fimbrillin family protein [Bacteroidales bacterium]